MNLNKVFKIESDNIVERVNEHIKETERLNCCNGLQTDRTAITEIIERQIIEVQNLNCWPEKRADEAKKTWLQKGSSLIGKFVSALNLFKYESILPTKTISRIHMRYIHDTAIRFFPKSVPYILSDIGEGIVDVVVKEWYVKTGDKIAQFDPVCEVQSDKASVTITSRFDGEVEQIHYQVDDVAKVGAPLLNIIVPDDHTSEPSTDASLEKAAPQDGSNERASVEDDVIYKDKALATPAVRRIAKENNINLKDVAATGKAGRVLKEDILAYLDSKSANTIKFSEPIKKTEQITTNEQDWTENIVGMRKAMIKTMTEAWKIPHFNYADDVDVTELLDFRKNAKLSEKAGVKVTYMPFLLKAVSLALLKYPTLNAQLNESNSQLKVHKNHNLGVAMDTPSGLVVPCIHHVQQRSVIDIARELQRLQLLGQQERLPREDLTGGTLTLSNIGAIGGTHASPVLLPPQVMIGAFCKIQRLPKFDDNGELIGRDMMTVSWSADHRAVDGATVARFSNLFKLYLSNPRLLLEL